MCTVSGHEAVAKWNWFCISSVDTLICVFLPNPAFSLLELWDLHAFFKSIEIGQEVPNAFENRGCD